MFGRDGQASVLTEEQRAIANVAHRGQLPAVEIHVEDLDGCVCAGERDAVANSEQHAVVGLDEDGSARPRRAELVGDGSIHRKDIALRVDLKDVCRVPSGGVEAATEGEDTLELDVELDGVPVGVPRLGPEHRLFPREPCHDVNRGVGGRGARADGSVHAEETLFFIFHAYDDAKGRGHGRDIEVGPGEGVEQANNGVALVDQDEEAAAEGDDPVAPEFRREAGAEAPSRAELDEGDLECVVRARLAAVVERDPAARAKVMVLLLRAAREVRAGAPAGAGRAEGDVVDPVEPHPLGDEADQVAGERRPAAALLDDPPALAAIPGSPRAPCCSCCGRNRGRSAFADRCRRVSKGHRWLLHHYDL